VADHKGSFGHLAIVAGSFGFHGAAVLAARGALRAQPGLVTVYPQENVYPAVAAQLQSPMVAVWKADMKLFDNATAILIGPGLAAPDLPDEMRNMARRLWRYADVPVVVDASAMDWLPAAAPSGQAIRVITPHPGEAARLLNSTAAKVQSNRFQAMRDLSRRFGCRVVLKGHQTLTGAATGNVFVNSTGNPHLAQGGSGDVLSGFIAGFLAQPALQGDCDGAIRYAVWRHGCAGDKLQAGGGGWVIEDLIGAMA
ncbi:MAG: NAD(P)H-hydrate dehydratase, partial [Verrucomicrobia bacterium]|nr:NAD(P)H-hydrate dehydratase [Verrucomicrobiota bacterium]